MNLRPYLYFIADAQLPTIKQWNWSQNWFWYAAGNSKAISKCQFRLYYFCYNFKCLQYEPFNKFLRIINISSSDVSHKKKSIWKHKSFKASNNNCLRCIAYLSRTIVVKCYLRELFCSWVKSHPPPCYTKKFNFLLWRIKAKIQYAIINHLLKHPLIYLEDNLKRRKNNLTSNSQTKIYCNWSKWATFQDFLFLGLIIANH